MESAQQQHVDRHFAQLTYALMDAVRCGQISPAHAYVWAVLHRRRAFGTSVCRARLATLAADAHCSVRQVERYLWDLQAAGFIGIERFRGTPSQYTLLDGEAPARSQLALVMDRPTTPVSAVDQPSTPATGGVTPPPPVAALPSQPPTPMAAPPPTPVSSFNKSTYQEVIHPAPSSTTEESRARPDGRVARESRGLSQDFVPSAEQRRWAVEKGLTVAELEAATEEFSSYWRGSGKTKKDWGQTWRNSLLKAIARKQERLSRGVPLVAANGDPNVPARLRGSRLLDPRYSPVEARRRIDWSQYDADGYGPDGVDPFGIDRRGDGPATRARRAQQAQQSQPMAGMRS